MTGASLAASRPDGAAEAPAPSGSSFYLGLRLLPPAQRRAMYAIYAFCRAVDDVADSTAPRDVRLAQLDAWRADVAALYAGAPPPRLGAVAAAVAAFDLQRADFEAILDGMASDVAASLDAPTWDALDAYCDRVASAPGRLSVRVFGLPDARGRELAHHLGRALQLTNILRDVDEDAAMGRLYLPREALAEAGLHGAPVAALLGDPRLDAACRAVAARAGAHFAAADAAMRQAPRRAVKAPRLMAAAYRPVLVRLLARGWAPPRPPVRKSKAALAVAVLRHGLL